MIILCNKRVQIIFRLLLTLNLFNIVLSFTKFFKREMFLDQNMTEDAMISSQSAPFNN